MRFDLKQVEEKVELEVTVEEERKETVVKKSKKPKKVKEKKGKKIKPSSLKKEPSVSEPHAAPLPFKEKQQQKKRIKKTLEIHPVKSWGSDEDENFFRYRYGYFEVVRMRGHNLFGMKQEEFQRITNSYAALTNMYSPPFKLVSIHSPVDTQAQQGFFRRRYQACEDHNQRKLLQENYEEQVFIGKYRQSEEFYVFIYGYDEEKLRENISDFYKSAGMLQLESLSKKEKVHLLFRMANPSLKIMPDEVPNLNITNKRIIEEQIDVNLLQQIQPQGNWRAGETYIRTGNGYSTCLHVYKLAPEPDLLWLMPFTKIKNKILTIDVATQEDENLKKEIKQSLVRLNTAIRSEKDITAKELKEEEYVRLLSLSKDIAKKREILKYITIRLYLYDDTLEALEKRVIETKKLLEKEEFGITNFTLEQEYEWEAMFLDYHGQLLQPNKRSGLDIASTEFGASYPANEVSLMDPRGKYFGLSNTSGQMMLDFFELDGERTFYNILITGMMGQGKTTLMKKIMDYCFSLGYLVRGFDKSGEFTDLVKKRGGTIVRLDGQDGRLNIFEIFPLSVSDHTLEVSQSGSMSIHLAKLGTWYSILKPNAPVEELDVFDTLVTDLYTEKGFINDDGVIGNVTGRPPGDYPILMDLYEIVDREMKTTNIAEHHKICYNIHVTLNKLLKTNRDMFNGPTTIPDFSDQQILFFNIDGLSNFDPRYVNAQLFNAFNLFSSTLFNNGRLQHKLYKDGVITFEEIRRSMFFMAEAHNLLNANNPRMVSYFNTYAREARKRYAGLCLDTQTARSLRNKQGTAADSDVSDESKDIYDFMQYRFFFRPGEGEEEELAESNGGVLTDIQAQNISTFGQGQTLLRIGKSEAYEMFVYASEAEVSLYNGGGRKKEDK
ncbi:nucleoside-triphosphatase [Vagococcus xieshaowenii]|uniref:Uncharacterized protein n=1 Tax=Vagococcus xieshaowenii TaxID=2562451 RepID=A0AAJ5JMB7_9ENTE|nr:nucleoside-triphosphatase [Vagococcus xieshaowenii]QCA29684.1 hypothetical protein E4Z98_09870 [Vagococcus xieshaowenii]TFZ42959.1 hypothetical protein E4031_01610 [Vagococcus xieshaowenii]